MISQLIDLGREFEVRHRVLIEECHQSDSEWK
jgi:hypothetical protein